MGNKWLAPHNLQMASSTQLATLSTELLMSRWEINGLISLSQNLWLQVWVLGGCQRYRFNFCAVHLQQQNSNAVDLDQCQQYPMKEIFSWVNSGPWFNNGTIGEAKICSFSKGLAKANVTARRSNTIFSTAYTVLLHLQMFSTSHSPALDITSCQKIM